MAMTDASALHDDATVIAPGERSPQLRQYLTMVMSADRVLSTRKEWQVDQLLELVQSRGEPVPLPVDSAIQLEGLRCLAQSIERDTYYDEIGQAFANYYLYDWITKYVQFARDLIAFPDIVSVPVAKPMFLIGYGRTGSTFLQHLLALDPDARSPRLWELMEPSPPPRPETYESDPRIRRVRMHREWNAILRRFPER
jgi:Sulfotransferase family